MNYEIILNGVDISKDCEVEKFDSKRNKGTGRLTMNATGEAYTMLEAISIKDAGAIQYLSGTCKKGNFKTVKILATSLDINVIDSTTISVNFRLGKEV